MRLTIPALLAMVIGATGAQAQSSRVFDLVDLSTPESAVEAYADAFAADDFVLAYFILDPLSHLAAMQAANRFEFSELVGLGTSEWVRAEEAVGVVGNELASDPEKPWLGPDILQIFVYMMTVADRSEGHLIDFGRSGNDLAVVSVGEPFVADGRMRAEIDTEVAGEGPVRFLLQQSPAGRWRVLSIVARPGTADEAAFLPQH